MGGGDCVAEPWPCYVRREAAGDGEVLIFAGFPPLSNALISRGDNARLAFRLVDGTEGIAFDEYHHFFTDRTVGDLLATPSFFFPLIGFVGIVLLFLIFGYSEYHETAMQEPSSTPARSHHLFNEKIVQGVMARPTGLKEGITRQATFMSRAFPRERDLIEQETRRLAGKYGASVTERDLLARAGELTALHRKILTQRRRLTS